MQHTNDAVEIILTWAEVLVAAQIGAMRNVQSLKAGRSGGNGVGRENTWTLNIEGACGEMALAKHLNKYWSGAIGDLKADDVGTLQVKTNTSRKYDDLILRKSDRANRYYVSALSFIDEVPRFLLTGWVYGADAMVPEHWRDGTPGRTAFFFPRKLLNPMATLPDKVIQQYCNAT